MNEDEKKAIEYIKKELEDEKKHHNHIYKGILGLYDNGSIEIILNLIEKQQKEIEELKLDLHEMTISNNHKKENWVPKEVLNIYIRKDKIKEKIRILEKLQKEFLNNNEIEIKIIAYKELLGE